MSKANPVAQHQSGVAMGPETQAEQGGQSLSPPPFSISAGTPLQRYVPGAGDGTNHRFDTGQITAADLADPNVQQQLRGLGIQGLQAYRVRVQDVDVQEYIDRLIAELTVPAAAAIADTRTRVLPSDRAMYNRLLTYMNALPARIAALVANPPARYASLQNNPNVNAVVARLQRVTAELQSERLVVRFDPTLTGTNTIAAYTFTLDTVRLRPIVSNADLGPTTASLLHEFMHTEQDRATEEHVRTTGRREEHTREDEITHEVQGRQSGVYMGTLLRALGDMGGADFDTLVSDGLFYDSFERERTGNRTQARAATRDIRREIADVYTQSGQIPANSPTATYYAELTRSNHVVLRHPAGQRDLGEVPANVTTQDGLSLHLIPRIEALSDFRGLFQGSTRSIQYNHITVLVFYQTRKLAEFVVCRNGIVNGQCRP